MAVVKLSDYRPPLEAVERKVAQLEDGYLRLANELLDATMRSGLPETELCIVMAVWRKTYGFSKKMDWISNEQLEAMIGKHLTHCSTAKNNLIRKKVLIQEGRKVGMNTDVSMWETKNNGFCKTLAKGAKETLAEVANGTKQKLLTTKDNNTKDKKENIPTLTRLEGGADDDSLKEKLINLLQGHFNFDNAKGLHDAVESEILKSGFLCQREFKVADRGDGRCGKVDLYVTDPGGGSCGIELDWKSPREKSVVKLQQLPAGFILLRETVLEERYEIAGISVVNANTGEIDKTPSGYYQSFMDAYNKITDGQLPSAKDLTPERKRAIKTLVNSLAKPNIEGFSAYLNAFLGMAKPFYFGDNDRNWTADFDYVLRPKILTKVREGSL